MPMYMFTKTDSKDIVHRLWFFEVIKWCSVCAW